MGTEGTLLITTNDEQSQRITAHTEELLLVDLALRPRWNTVTLKLEAGAFRPSEIQEGSGDSRLLSFAAAYVELITTEQP